MANQRNRSATTEQVPLQSPNVASELQLQINDLNQKLQHSQSAVAGLQQELRSFEKERKSLDRWFNKIPFVIILLSFIAVGVGSYLYPIRSDISWIWHGKPDVITENFQNPPTGDTPKIIVTVALWVGYGVLWQIFVLVNVTDLIKYLHVYSRKKFRFLARLTMFAAFVGGCFMLVMCIHASNLIEHAMSEHYPIKWLFTSIIMVVPLVGALMLSGGLPTHLAEE